MIQVDRRHVGRKRWPGKAAGVSEMKSLLKCGFPGGKMMFAKKTTWCKNDTNSRSLLIRKTPDERWNLDVHFTLPDGSLITHMVLSDHLYRR